MRISDLPMVDDIDADCSPQYVKFARILWAKIASGDIVNSTVLLAVELAHEYAGIGSRRSGHVGDTRRQWLRQSRNAEQPQPRDLESSTRAAERYRQTPTSMASRRWPSRITRD